MKRSGSALSSFHSTTLPVLCLFFNEIHASFPCIVITLKEKNKTLRTFDWELTVGNNGIRSMGKVGVVVSLLLLPTQWNIMKRGGNKRRGREPHKPWKYRCSECV